MGRHLQWKERRNSKGLLSLHWGFVVVQPPPNHKQPLLTPPCKRLIQFQECVIIPSILMYSSFQSCDCLQSTFGMLCYSIRTPQDIFEALARAGLSISILATFLGEKSWALEHRKHLKPATQWTCVVAWDLLARRHRQTR